MKAIIFFLSILAIGCKPSLETCNRFYPPQEKEIVKDSVVYQKETLIIPGDTTYVSFPFNCAEDSLKRINEIFKGKMGKYALELKYINRQLYFWLKRYNDSIASYNKYEQKKEVKIEKVLCQVDKPYIPTIFWILFIIAILVIILFLLRFLKIF